MVRRTFVGLMALVIAFPALAGAGSPSSDCCCDFANSISAEVASLSAETGYELDGSVPAAQLGQLLKALGKTMETLGQGVVEGDETCDGRKARQKFQYAKGFLKNYREILASLGLGGGYLDSWAADLETQISDLVAGLCDGGSGSGSGSGSG